VLRRCLALLVLRQINAVFVRVCSAGLDFSQRPRQCGISSSTRFQKTAIWSWRYWTTMLSTLSNFHAAAAVTVAGLTYERVDQSMYAQHTGANGSLILTEASPPPTSANRTEVHFRAEERVR
jgi:hypothetical protein